MISIRALREKTVWRETAPSMLLVLNSFVWYIFTYAVFTSTVNGMAVPEAEKLGLFVTYYLSVAVSAVLGGKFLSRRRIMSLNLWPLTGAIATLLLIGISSGDALSSVLIALFLGASIGVGLPSCLSYFADSTSVENRGFVSGITWSIIGTAVLVFAFLINSLGLWEAIIALTAWRLFGGAGFLVLNRKHQKLGEQKSPNYLGVLRKKEILLYLFPWVMFSIVNFAEAPLLEQVFGAGFAFVQVVEYALAGVIAVLAGTLADITGRKRIVIAGFVMLGIEYATMSVFSSSPATLYLFLALDGTTWGLFLSVFLTVIWGDLGEDRAKEKYYTLGGLPFLLAGFLSILIKPYASAIPPGTAFSFASFFLFLAVIPLMYAPETLSEKTMKDRELKNYLAKAQKEVAKVQKKEDESNECENKDEKDSLEFKVNQEDDEKARELAEKYY
jgi:MFS family permease